MGDGRLPPLEPRVACVLGMHRSGTSALAGTLEEAGVYLGDVSHLNTDNARGNFENRAIIGLHEGLLVRNGGSWDVPPANVGWNRKSRRRRDAIIEDYAGAPCWGFKDPRTLLTVEGWLEALPGLLFVGTIRHPAAVARSLQSRSGLPFERGITLWCEYNRRLLALHEERSFPLVCFDDEPGLLRASLVDAVEALELTPPAHGFSFFEAELRGFQPADGTDGEAAELYDELRRRCLGAPGGTGGAVRTRPDGALSRRARRADRARGATPRGSRPSVSICIPAWRAIYLEEAIRSVLEQTHDDLEVVVADDAGNLEQVVSAIGDPRIRYYRNPCRMGVAANAAVALNLARGRYLGLLGDDDRLLPRYVEEAVRRLEADPTLGIACTSHYYDVAGRLFRRTRPLAEGRYEQFLPLFLRHRPVHIHAALMRREVWEEGERRLPMPEDVTPDLLIFARAALAGWPFYYVDSPLMVYRVHEGQVSSSARNIDRSIALWDRLQFDDPESEQLRRSTLARKYVVRAGHRLKTGRAEGARADLESARATYAGAARSRRLALSALACAPSLVPAAQVASRVVRAVRPWRNPWLDGSAEVGRRRAGREASLSDV